MICKWNHLIFLASLPAMPSHLFPLALNDLRFYMWITEFGGINVFLREFQSKRETWISDGIVCPPAPTHIFFLVLACQFTLWNSLSARCIAVLSHLG
jgi:hypothetical protein